MGLRFYKRIKLGRKTSLNLGKRGASISHKFCRFITVNSRGILTLSIPKTGLSYRINFKKWFRFMK